MIYTLGDRRLETRGEHWIAETAVVVGDVLLEENASIWWGAVLRGDNERITVGRNSNVQDGQRAAHGHGIAARDRGLT